MYGEQKNFTRAMAYLLKAAAHRSDDAHFSLAMLYRYVIWISRTICMCLFVLCFSMKCVTYDFTNTHMQTNYSMTFYDLNAYFLSSHNQHISPEKAKVQRLIFPEVSHTLLWLRPGATCGLSISSRMPCMTLIRG